MPSFIHQITIPSEVTAFATNAEDDMVFDRTQPMTFTSGGGDAAYALVALSHSDPDSDSGGLEVASFDIIVEGVSHMPLVASGLLDVNFE